MTMFQALESVIIILITCLVFAKDLKYALACFAVPIMIGLCLLFQNASVPRQMNYVHKRSNSGAIHAIFLIPMLVYVQLNQVDASEINLDIHEISKMSAQSSALLFLFSHLSNQCNVILFMFSLLWHFLMETLTLFLPVFLYEFTALNACAKIFPGTFTFGESTTVIKAIGLITFDFVRRHQIFSNTKISPNNEKVVVIEIIVASTVMTVISLLPSIYLMKQGILQSEWTGYMLFYITCMLNILFVFTPVFTYVLNKNPVSWLLQFISYNYTRLLLMAFWLFLLVVTFAAILFYLSNNLRLPKTIVRKFFHVIALLIFMPASLDFNFVAVVSLIISMLFIIVEIIRVVEVKPFYKIFDMIVVPFKEENDQGTLVVTHLYLLLGLSIPIMMYPQDLSNENGNISKLAYSAGVTSVAVGDTCASIFGTLYGKTKWPNSNKTYLGSVFCFLSQLLFLLSLGYFTSIQLTLFNISYLMFCCLLTTLIEATSKEIDNLILPLYLYILLIVPSIK